MQNVPSGKKIYFSNNLFKRRKKKVSTIKILLGLFFPPRAIFIIMGSFLNVLDTKKKKERRKKLLAKKKWCEKGGDEEKWLVLHTLT
jgi:hypothetical protein